MKAVKKVLPIFAVLLVIGIFVYSVASEKSGDVKKYGFACGSEVTVSVSGTFKGEEKAQKAIDESQKLDKLLLSDTLPSSKTYQLNKTGHLLDDNGELVSYINECMALTEKCPQMTILSKPFSIAWDITGNGRVPSKDEINETLQNANPNNLKLNGNEITLSNGALISFGAFGKGTVCEKAIETLKSENVKCALVTVGGTVGVLNSKNNTTLIGVRNPFLSAGEYFATVEVNNGYLSTSGDYEKFFEKDGKKYCHIFDATTGCPVESNITSVTVITNSGTASDFLSTAIFILGENGLSLAKEMNAQVIIVNKDKSVIASKSLEGNLKLTNNDFTVIYK